MRQDAVKLELIEWLTKLNNTEIIGYLKNLKDSNPNDMDWWNDLSEIQKQGIERGLNDIEQGRTTTHEEVKKKYGL